MTECRHFRSYWSRYKFEELAEADSLRLRQQLEVCRRCQQYDRQMQAVVQCLKGLGHGGNELESARAERLLERAYQRHRSVARGRHAMAATLLAGFIGGAAFWAAVSGVRQESPAYPMISHAQTIALPIAGIKNISLAIDSDRALADVTFTIELPDGVEVDGYPGQRELSWQGQLQAGLNRLTLPLLTHRQAREGVLKARIEYAGGGRELLLPLKPAAGSAALPNGHWMPQDVIEMRTWRYLS
jgi:hypothetical protein